ncbi:EAL domain-containing protein [Novacetimonas cocois]|uniref:EAL domain-containing protein n=1 Tax=Novacetimonas cocois TaxID=1747507 RepID=UPI0023B34135|nr:EAL domain-containing protein [Novacetimonas cocois]
MNVVAEGVETQTQYKLLKDMQCDVIQGYLFSRPLPPAELAQWCHLRKTSKSEAPVHA